MIEVREYTEPHGRSPFQQWFEDLEARAAAKVTVALARLQQGNVSNVKGVGGGVLELRIDYGPGYRVYYLQRGMKYVLLLAGGDKSSQARDIARAKRLLEEYEE